MPTIGSEGGGGKALGAGRSAEKQHDGLNTRPMHAAKRPLRQPTWECATQASLQRPRPGVLKTPALSMTASMSSWYACGQGRAAGKGRAVPCL